MEQLQLPARESFPIVPRGTIPVLRAMNFFQTQAQQAHTRDNRRPMVVGTPTRSPRQRTLLARRSVRSAAKIHSLSESANLGLFHVVQSRLPARESFPIVPRGTIPAPSPWIVPNCSTWNNRAARPRFLTVPTAAGLATARAAPYSGVFSWEWYVAFGTSPDSS